MGANEGATDIYNLKQLQIAEGTDALKASPTINLSGSVYISGGALCFKGLDGTITPLANLVA